MGNQAAWTMEVYNMHGPPGTVHLPSTQSLEQLGPEGHKTHSPCGSVTLQSTQESERLRPGKCSKCRAHLGQCLCRAPWRLSSVDLGSTHARGLWQTPCGPSTVSSPHTCQWYLFAVSIPLHSTIEQVSLRPLMSRQKLDTEETCKQRKAK